MMENKKVKIFFFGSGAFAVPVLEALCLNPKIQMCGIITQPDKPGRAQDGPDSDSRR